MTQRLCLVLLMATLVLGGCGTLEPGDPYTHVAQAKPAGHAAPHRSPNTEPMVGPIPLPTLADLHSAHVSYGVPTEPDQVPQTLFATHPRHRVRLALLLDRLADSEIISGDLTPPSREAILHLALANGETLSVRQAYHCHTSPDGEGAVQTCTGAPGEIIIQIGPNRGVRVRNPAMSRWLSDGWRDDFPLGAAELLDRETALEIARIQDPKAPWRANFQEEYPIETKEGTKVRPAWVVDAESPAGSKRRLVIDALTGEVLLQGQLEGLP